MQALLKLTNFVQNFRIMGDCFCSSRLSLPRAIQNFCTLHSLPFRFGDVWHGDYLNFR